MTVAAGFVVENGIVLCADSQETAGDFKFPVEKVITQRITSGVNSVLEVAIAGSGYGPLVDMASQRIARVIVGIDRRPYGYEEIEERMGEILNELYEKQFKLYPVEQQETIIDLLVAVKNRGDNVLPLEDEPILFHTSATTISRVADYRIIGSGRAAQYQIQNLYGRHISTWKANLLAMYLLSVNKSVLTSVGGKSRVITIYSSDKQMGVASQLEIGEAEKLFDELSIEWRFLLDIANSEAGEHEFTYNLDMFSKRLVEIHDKFKQQTDRWKSVIDALTRKE